MVSPSSFPAQNELPLPRALLSTLQGVAPGGQWAGGLELRPPMLLGTVPGVEVKVEVLVTQSGPTLCDPVYCSPPGSSTHEIFLARILEWIAISYSRGSS